MDKRRDDEVVAYKIEWMDLVCNQCFTKKMLEVNSREASMDANRGAVSVLHTIICHSIFYMRKASFCLLERTWEIRQILLKRVTLWIKKRDGNVLKGR